MADKVFKLPLFAKTQQLKPIPGGDTGRVFMITSAIAPQPERSMGYVVEAAGPRRVMIHAWLALGGAIYACDEPLAKRPERDSDAGISKDDEGEIVFYVNREGRIAKVAHLAQREQDGRVSVVDCRGDLGAYGSGAYDIDEMGAACFLSQWLFPRERGEEYSLVSVADVLDGLLTSSYPDALDAVVYRGRREGAGGFERFASRSLMAAGAERVRPIAAAHDIDLRRLGSTGLFWTACNKSELDEAELDTLQAVEGALNRLVFMERELGDGQSPLVGDVTEEACERSSLASLCTFASVAPRLMRGCDRTNDFSTVLGAESARGGEWDVRTRFAAATEGLRAPFGFDYRFDCDAGAGVFAVDVAVPSSSAFPATDQAGRNALQAAYVLRLAATLAAVAFGSGVGVIRAVVTAHERTLAGRAIASLELSRQLFAMEVMPLIQSGELLKESLTAADLIKMLSPVAVHMEVGADGGLCTIEPLDAGLPDRSVKMADDRRPLPDSLLGLLHADTVADLDIFDADDDPLRDRYREICERYKDDSAQADGASGSIAAELVDLIAAYDMADALQDSDARPLYCVSMVARAVVGQVDEDESVRYRKIPDTAYDARSMLCRIYREQGNIEDAIGLAEDLVRLAPTSFTSYHSLALTYREGGRDRDAVEALIDGLRFAADPTDIACAYYRLGFLFWQGGDPALGLACYTLVRPNTLFFGEAQSEIGELMQESHIHRRPTIDEASAALRADGVPVAPVSQLGTTSARAAVALVDAGLFDAANSLVHFLSSIDVGPNSFDVLAQVRRSLSRG